MKHFLLALAAAALLCGNATAQVANHLKLSQKPQFATRISPKTICGSEKMALPFAPKAKMSTKAVMADDESEAEPTNTFRSGKILSYFTSIYGLDQMAAISTGLTADNVTNSGFTGWGYGAYYPYELLSRYWGNTIKRINIYAWNANYSDTRAFIAKSASDGSLQMLWEKDITLKAAEGGNIASAAVDCDYELPISTDGLFIGWCAGSASYASTDTNAESKGIIAALCPDSTGAGYDGLLFVSNGDKVYVGSQLTYGNSSVINPVFSVTEGDKGVQLEDAALLYVDDARGYAGHEGRCNVQLINLGLDSIKSIRYTFSSAKQAELRNYTLPEPVYFMNQAQLYLPVRLPFNEGYNDAKFEIVKVNGVDDQFSDYTDNVDSTKLISFTTGYKRVPVVEEFTSPACSNCIFGIPGLKNAADSVNNRIVTIAPHVTYNRASDDLILDEYDELYNNFGFSSLPTTLVNREYTSDPYYELPSLVQSLSTQDCEASVGLSCKKSLQGIKVSATVNFTTPAPDDQYSLACVVTEDGISASQANVLAQIYKQYGEETTTNYYGNYDDLVELMKTPIDANGYSTVTLNHVARVTSNLDGTDGTYALNGITQNVPVTFDFPTIKSKNVTNTANANVAVLLIDNTTSKIVTARQVALGSSADLEEAVTSVNNAVADANEQIAEISAKNGAFTVKAEGAVASVYNAEGRLVSSATVNGEVSLPTFGKGVFIIRVTKGNHTTTEKAVF